MELDPVNAGLYKWTSSVVFVLVCIEAMTIMEFPQV